jgi:hypothetical protein
MEDIDLPRSPSVNKPTCSPLNPNRQRNDSASVIQQADVSSSRPALLAHDALGPLLFEVCVNILYFFLLVGFSYFFFTL